MGALPAEPPAPAAALLAEALQTLEAAGLCPVAPDGKVAGNGAFVHDGRLYARPLVGY